MIPKLLKSVEFKRSKIHIPIDFPIDREVDFFLYEITRYVNNTLRNNTYNLYEITRYVLEMTHISNKKEYLLDENLMFYN